VPDLAGLADGDVEAAFTSFTDPLGDGVGLLSIAGFELVSVLQQTVQTMSDAVQSAVSEDTDFIAGLPGLF
jgi:hypothetical protein